jgi:MFS family permease
MLAVLRDSWVLLLGMLLLMLGNGLQGTLLGVRGAIEGFSPGALSVVMSGYFVGLLLGAWYAPRMVRRVGHIRVFSALAALISAGFLVYAAFPEPWVWTATRVLVGFCFSGVYIVAESWLNDRATNETRGQAMSAYMIVQTGGVVIAQGLLTLADPGGFALFALISALVSVAVAPMLLTVTPVPMYQTAKPMSLGQLFRASPLGCVSAFILGGVFSGMFGMAAVYGGQAGLTVGQISIFVAALYAGGLAAQAPVGWLSDRMDRRLLIVAVCVVGVCAGLLGAVVGAYWATVACAALIGAVANPLYGLVIAHTNDFLQPEEMTSASSGLLVLNGVGAIGGPLAVGQAMERLGAFAFFAYFAMLFSLIAAYGAWRMTRRTAPPVEETAPYAAVTFASRAVAMDVVTELAAEAAEEMAQGEPPEDAIDADEAEGDASARHDGS